MEVAASPADCFAVVAGLGGRTGWPPYSWLWRLRGTVDLLLGGVGMRRGRPEGRALRVGDALDFWRVEACEPATRLRLAAEMRLPGRAWLEFDIVPSAAGSRIRQTAVFDPVGLAGLVYWYLLLPFHVAIFRGLLRSVARRAAAAPRPDPA